MRLSRRSSRRSVTEGTPRHSVIKEETVDERSVGGTITGNTLLAISPLHAPNSNFLIVRSSFNFFRPLQKDFISKVNIQLFAT